MRLRALFLAVCVSPVGGTLSQEAPFLRADTNQDGDVNITDAVLTLNVLFLGTPALSCDDAVDANDDSGANVTDAIYTLCFLFLGGPEPPPPFEVCGTDGTADSLGCSHHAACAAAACFDDAALDALIAEQVPPEVCVDPDAVEVDTGIVVVKVCPGGAAPASCGAAQEPGCPVRFTRIDGTLEIPERRAVVEVEGRIDDMPVVLENVFSSVTCDVDVTFSADAIVPFRTVDAGEGRLEISEILDLMLVDVVVTLTATGGTLCDVLEAQQETFVDLIVEELEAAAADLLQDLNDDLVGVTLCPP